MQSSAGSRRRSIPEMKSLLSKVIFVTNLLAVEPVRVSPNPFILMRSKG
jgi:hypothetical protein